MRCYFDHASTSPLRPEAKEAMLAALEVCGDPGRIYSEALEARILVEQAREQVARFLGAMPRCVVFTSGATEAIASVVRGSAMRGRHHVASLVEHTAVLKSINAEMPAYMDRTESALGDGSPIARSEGNGTGNASSTLVGADSYGRVMPDDLLSAVNEETAVVHLQMVNQETGTLQDVKEAACLCRELGVWLHVDAAQAAGHVEVNFNELGADFMSVAAHKFGGPTGVGALLVRRGVRLEPLLAGGNQERARRAGLENIAAIAGFGAVCESLGSPAEIGDKAEAESIKASVGVEMGSKEATEGIGETNENKASAGRTRTKPCEEREPSQLDSEAGKHFAMTRRIREELTSLDDIGHIGHPTEHAPHIVCFHIADVEPQALVVELDRRGFAVHSGNACSSELLEPSPVLAAMGHDDQRSLRISVGWPTTDADVDALLSNVSQVLANLRSLRLR